MGPTLAVDIGGTNLRAAVVDDDGTILARAHAATPRQAPDPALVVALSRPLRDAHPVERAVVALPGRVDHHDGTLLHGPNLPPGWVPQLTRDALETALDVPVSWGNDADVAALGEARFGAGRGHDDLVYVTVSTGVGAGIVVGGQLVRPRRSAGEVGHSVIDRILATAGRDGTVEGLGSGTALAAAARAAGLDVLGADLVTLVRDGDETARRVWDDAMFAVALGVVNLAHLVAPTIVVVGGGVGRNRELVTGPIRAVLDRLGPVGPPIPVVTAALGDDSGLIGAAAWRGAT